MMQVEDRVALRRGGWTGVVRGVTDGRVRVAFDNGGSGIFPEADLRILEDKAWPPRTIESK